MNKFKTTTIAMNIAFVITIIVSLCGSFYLGLDIKATGINLLFAFTACGSLSRVIMEFQGWKLSQLKIVFGMPRILFRVYLFFLLLIISMSIGTILIDNSNDSALIADNMNIKGFIISASVGILTIFVSWYIGLNEYYAMPNEYSCRIQFQHMGYSQDEIEKHIKALRAKGTLGTFD